MKFYGTLKVYRYEENWNPEITEIFAEHFEAKSIQAAKAKLTKIANETELFSWIQSWDNENTHLYTGKDLRWKPWSSPPATYKQDNGVEVAYSAPVCPKENLGRPFIPKGTRMGNLSSTAWTSLYIGGSRVISKKVPHTYIQHSTCSHMTQGCPNNKEKNKETS